MFESIGRRIRDFVAQVQDELRRPYLIFEITQRCNLNCRHCYNVWKGHEEYPPGELDINDVKELLCRAIEGSGSGHVTFTGGEPLLRGDLEDVVSFLTRRNVTSTLITNGTLLTEERCKSLVAAGVGLFEFPLNAADREIYNYMAGAEAFDKVVEAIVNVQTAGGQAAGVFVATKLNIEQWPEVINLSIALGLVGMLFNRFNPGGTGLKNINELLIDDLRQLTDALRVADEAVAANRMSIGIAVPIPDCVIEHSQFEHLQFHGCSAGTPSAYWTIDPLGNVRPCNHSATILGNLLEKDFSDIASSKEMESWLASTPSTCRQCGKFKNCQGGCKAAAEACHGSIEKAEPFVQMLRRDL